MQYKREEKVVCLGDPKQAALYLDTVAPVSLIAEAWSDLKISEKEKSFRTGNTRKGRAPLHQIFRELTNTNDLPEPEFRNLLKLSIETTTYLLAAVKLRAATYPYIPRVRDLIESTSMDKETRELSEYLFELLSKPSQAVIPSPSEKISNKMNEIAKKTKGQEGLLKISDLLELIGMCYLENSRVFSGEMNEKGMTFRELVYSFPPWIGKRPDVLLPSGCFDNYEAGEGDVTLSITNIPLVDTKKGQWDQILEFRKDRDSRKKLRNLRLFLHTNYQGKTLAFIEDDLNKRLDEYYNACKDWGFETLTSSISALTDSKNLVELLEGSTCATLFGGPLVGLATGASIELAKIVIMLAKKRHAFHKLKRDHDLAYLIEAKQQIVDS